MARQMRADLIESGVAAAVGNRDSWPKPLIFTAPVTFKVELATPDRAASFLGRTGVEVVGPLTVQGNGGQLLEGVGCILVSDINAEQDIPLSSSNLNPAPQY